MPFIGDGSDKTHFGYIFGASSYSDHYYSIPKSLKSVTITGSTSISNYAFYDCTYLTSVTIGDSVTSIGEHAFYKCEGLTSVNYLGTIAQWCNISFGDSLANPLYYAKNLYINNELVTSLVIPNTVTEIKAYAFYGCTSLTSITIPDSVTSIGRYAFSGCTSLTSVVIPDSVTSIGSYAFEYCDSLTSVNYLGTVAQWCNISFGNSYANPLYYAKNLYINNELVTSLVIPNTVTEIKDYAFYNCTPLTSVTIPDSVTTIGSGAFYGCEKLSSIVIPDRVTRIGIGAFRGCTSLTSVTIPDSVTIIESYAFENCTSLTIYCEAKSKPSGWSYYWNHSGCTVKWGHVHSYQDGECICGTKEN